MLHIGLVRDSDKSQNTLHKRAQYDSVPSDTPISPPAWQNVEP